MVSICECRSWRQRLDVILEEIDFQTVGYDLQPYGLDTLSFIGSERSRPRL
jgi:hypothetical protein